MQTHQEPDRSPEHLTRLLLQWSDELRTCQKRCYEDESDWDAGRTHFEGPVIYLLWGSADATRPLYVGQTRNLGKRLWEHWHSEWNDERLPTGWSGGDRPSHVTYINVDEFDRASVLSLFERFLMAVWEPPHNDLRK